MLKKFIAILVVSLAVHAKVETNKIIYGKDNRQDVYELKDKKRKEFAKSIAGRVGRYSLFEKSNTKTFSLDGIPLLSSSRGMNVCLDERFSLQPTAVDCTGFLISDNLLVTAGHCMVDPGKKIVNKVTEKCAMYAWMFDYKVNQYGEIDLKNISEDNIFYCKNVIAGIFGTTEDFALIELDRKAKDRAPLKFNKKNRVVKNQEIFVMGHPTGLPLKYADQAKVFHISKDYFITNLDTFGGNSGSPVFNANTNLVEGILVRGDTDYYEVTLEDGSKCNRVNFCDDDRENCKEDDRDIKGEHVTLIKKVISNL